MIMLVDFAKITNTNILILLQTADKLAINCEILDWEKYKIKLTKNGKTHIITCKSMGINPSNAIAISKNKYLTVKTLKKAGLPVLSQIKVKNTKDYQNHYHLISFPQVIKPLFGEKGKDIYLNIQSQIQGLKVLKQYFKKAKKIQDQTKPYCLVEPYFKAKDYRFMVLNYQVIGFSQRIPPVIIGNDKNNIRQLIEQENQKRLNYNQKAGRRMLNRMLNWQRTKWNLAQQSYQLTDIPFKNQKITVYPIPNFSTGGTVKTIGFDKIHPEFIKLACQTAKTIGLKICGIDILIKDLKRPANNKNCAIIEVNSDPGLRLHDWPNTGKPQKVTEKILGYIFKTTQF